ncbi:alpha-latrocrustotoxin-Lt1a-like [Haliotis cracherodii]|uniref:alpha-latrocrustotoxin-Lt1a-like n=1 Tax=Haliotis cracherodii TaxID=6455 RepID=UPI0039EBD8C5
MISTVAYYIMGVAFILLEIGVILYLGRNQGIFLAGEVRFGLMTLSRDSNVGDIALASGYLLLITAAFLNGDMVTESFIVLGFVLWFVDEGDMISTILKVVAILYSLILIIHGQPNMREADGENDSGPSDRGRHGCNQGSTTAVTGGTAGVAIAAGTVHGNITTTENTSGNKVDVSGNMSGLGQMGNGLLGEGHTSTSIKSDQLRDVNVKTDVKDNDFAITDSTITSALLENMSGAKINMQNVTIGKGVSEQTTVGRKTDMQEHHTSSSLVEVEAKIDILTTTINQLYDIVLKKEEGNSSRDIDDPMSTDRSETTPEHAPQGKHARGRSPLMNAARAGNKEDFFKLLQTQKINSEKTDYKGNTILHLACLGGNLDIVKHLVEKEGLSLQRNGQHNMLPLVIAAERGYEEMFRYFVKKDTNLDGLDQGHMHHHYEGWYHNCSSKKCALARVYFEIIYHRYMTFLKKTFIT